MADNDPLSDRVHGLDAVRAFALLLGILFHGATSFVPGLHGVGWSIADTQQSEVLAFLYFLLHIFRMATFFMVAGFFAHLMINERGEKYFIKDRVQRIGGTLLLWFPPVFLAVLLLLIWAAQKDPTAIVQVRPSGSLPFAWLHFWFLYVLMLLYLIMIGVRRVTRISTIEVRVDAALLSIFRSRVRVLMLAVPVAVCLWCMPDWRHWSGIPAWTSIDPPIASLGIYLYVFAIGMALNRQRKILVTLRHDAAFNCAIGLACVVAFVLIAKGTFDFSAVAIKQLKPVLALCYGAALVSISLGMIGLGLRVFNKNRTWVRYLADASFWIYIWHVPMVMLMQIALMDLELWWLAKYLAVLTLTFAPLIIVYDKWVRSTSIGQMMNGKKLKPFLFRGSV